VVHLPAVRALKRAASRLDRGAWDHQNERHMNRSLAHAEKPKKQNRINLRQHEEKGEVVMIAWKRFSAILSLFIVFISACKAGTPPPTPITTLDVAQWGKISYGTVAGATTQAAAMSKILISMQNTCGEKPQIGKVFQLTFWR
jgi:hypothetical protein